MPTPVFGPTSIVLHGSAVTIREIVEAAGRQVFPEAAVVDRSGLAAEPNTAAESAREGSLLIMRDPDSATLTQAHNELDETGLPRWAVIAVVDSRKTIPFPATIDVLQHDELSSTLLPYVLRSAWERHQLHRTNRRLRGFLMTFGSRISHDLRTPLGGILTTAEMLREVLTEDAPANVPLIQPIVDSTDGLAKLIERSSFFARASASLEPRQVLDMAMPFWSAYQQVERLIIKSRFTLEHPPIWPKVAGHETWLEIVWRILLHNAVEHSPEATRIAAGWTAQKGELRFWIRSEGSIPPEKRASLFFPFQRLHEPGAPRGLGLPMMRALVELEGGSCGFEAPPTGGVELFFVLPGVPEIDSTADPNRVSR